MNTTTSDNYDFLVYESDYIKNHYIEIRDICIDVSERFKCNTDNYYEYNIFSLTATSMHFYYMLKELVNVIKMYNDFKDEPLWFQSWTNVHKQSEVLDWHNHNWDIHGYICIDPKDSITKFLNYEIHNKIGCIYIGPCDRQHKVVVSSDYSDKRVTIGFDVTRKRNMDGNKSLIPIL